MKREILLVLMFLITPGVLAVTPTNVYDGFMQMYYANQTQGKIIMIPGDLMQDYKAEPEDIDPFTGLTEESYVDTSTDGEITINEAGECSQEHVGKRCVDTDEDYYTGVCNIVDYEVTCQGDCYEQDGDCWREVIIGGNPRVVSCAEDKTPIYGCARVEWNTRTGAGCGQGECTSLCNNGMDDDADTKTDASDEDCQNKVEKPLSCEGITCPESYDDINYLDTTSEELLCCMNFPKKMEEKVLSLPMKFTFGIKGETEVSSQPVQWPESWENNWDATAGKEEWQPTGCHVDPYARDEEGNIVTEEGVMQWKNCGEVKLNCEDKCAQIRLQPNQCQEIIGQDECYLIVEGKHGVDAIPQEDAYTDLTGDSSEITIERMDKTFPVYDFKEKSGGYAWTGKIKILNAIYECEGDVNVVWEQCTLTSVDLDDTSTTMYVSSGCEAGNEASYQQVREWKYCYDLTYDYDTITSVDYGQNVPITVYENKLGFLDYNYFPYCGNGVAETELGENCQNCPQDMSSTYCPLYGAEGAVCNPNCPAQTSDECGYMIRVGSVKERLADNEQEIKKCWINSDQFEYVPNGGTGLEYFKCSGDYENCPNNNPDGGLIQRTRACVEGNWLTCCWWMVIPGFGQGLDWVTGSCGQCLEDICFEPNYEGVHKTMQDCVQEYEDEVSENVEGEECTSSCECPPGSTCTGTDQTPGKYCCPQGMTWTPLGCQESVGDYNIQRLMEWAEGTYMCDVNANFGRPHFWRTAPWVGWEPTNPCHPFEDSHYTLDQYPDNNYQYPKPPFG